MNECASERFGPALYDAWGTFHTPNGDLAKACQGGQLGPNGFAEVAVGSDCQFAERKGANDCNEGKKDRVCRITVFDPNRRAKIFA